MKTMEKLLGGCFWTTTVMQVSRSFVLYTHPGYMGDCSGAAFYSALMETLSRLSIVQAMPPPLPANSYQTWDSRILPISLAETDVLPPMHLTLHLVDVYHYHCGDQFRFIDREEFDSQLRDLQTAGSGMTTVPALVNRSSFLCRLYLIMAIGCLYLDRSTAKQYEDPSGLLHVENDDSPCPGLTFFARASFLLSALERSSEVASIVALSLAVCYHLRSS